MKLIGKASQYEKILAHMRDPESTGSALSDHDIYTLDRWTVAHSLIGNYTNTADAVAILMKRFPGTSRATAYRDCSNAISLFGDISKSTKEGIRHLCTQIALDGVAIAKAKNNEDGLFKGANTISKINGVNLTDPDLIDWSLVESNTYEFGLPQDYLDAFKTIVAGGVVDLAEMVNRMGNSAEEATIIDEEDND